MANRVHGHEVMQIMIDSGQTYGRASLRAEMAERFGPDATFHTCSAQDLSADELIDLLAARGKFVETTEGYTTAAEKICRH